MPQATFDPSRLLDLFARVSRDGSIVINFTDSVSLPYDISSDEFEFFVKEKDQATSKKIQLTEADGIVNSGTSLEITLTQTDTTLRENIYYYELLNLTRNKTWLCGNFTLHNGKFDGVTQSNTLVITDESEVITIQINQIGQLSTSVFQDDSLPTLTPNISLYDAFELTAQAEALTIVNPTGSIGNFDLFAIRVTDNGTAQDIFFGDKYIGLLPVKTTPNETLLLEFIYDSTKEVYDYKNQINAIEKSIYVEQYGAIGNGVLDCTTFIQECIDENVGKVIVIGSDITDVYIVSNAIVLPSNTSIVLNGTLKLANANIRPLLSNVSNSATSCEVQDAGTYFRVGQKITLSDNAQPVNGGGAWKTRLTGQSNVIQSIVGNTINFTNTYSNIPNGGFFTAQSAVIAPANCIFIIDGDDDISIAGIGILDGNLANQLNVASATYQRLLEDLFSACGISFADCENITISGIKIKDFVLHGISTNKIIDGTTFSDFVTIDNVEIDGCVDKSIAGIGLRYSEITNCTNTNGVDEGDIILYNYCENVKISNIFSKGNRRYGVAIIGGLNKNITIDNCISVVTSNKQSVSCFSIASQFYSTIASNLTATCEYMSASWTRSGTTATITTPVPHNIVNGARIYVDQTNDATAFTRGYFVVTVLTPTTFTLVCNNAGLTQNGGVNYFSITTGPLFLIDSSKNVSIKNLAISNCKFSNSLSTQGQAPGATESSDIKIDGLQITNGYQDTATSIYGIACSATKRISISNFYISDCRNVFLDAATNSDIRLIDGSIFNYTTLISSNNGKFRFEKVNGIVTENSSTATITSAANSITINHLLNITPVSQNIKVIPINSLGDSTKFWISDITNNNFRINVDVAPGSTTARFRWCIETFMGDVTAEPTYTVNYASDYSAGEDGWGVTRAVQSGNNDGVSDGTTSFDNVYKVYADGTANNDHSFSRAIAVVGVQNRISFWYYIPSGQTNVNGMRIFNGAPAINNDLLSPILGTWTRYTSNYFIPTTTSVLFRMTRNELITFSGLNDPNDDRIFITDVLVETI